MKLLQAIGAVALAVCNQVKQSLSGGFAAGKQVLAQGGGIVRAVVVGGGVAVLGFASAPSVHAAYNIVSLDQDGEVVFTPGGLVTPITQGIVGIIGAVAVIWVIVSGTKALIKWVRG